MPTVAENWVRGLKAGVLGVSDLQALSSLPAQDLLAGLRAEYPLPFLEGQARDKQEIGLARTRRGPRYRRCVILTFEAGRLTSLAEMTFLRIRPSPKHADDTELTCGAGFNVYHDPDGWRVKLLEERTVTLANESLKK